jgi:DNA-binding transcriptional MerR regulator
VVNLTSNKIIIFLWFSAKIGLHLNTLSKTYNHLIISTEMPYKEREINKMYYTMGEVTEMFGVNASQIRFYEKEFEVLKPKKNKKGNRLFTPEDIENLKIIFHLVDDKGFTLKGAKEHMKSNSGEVKENQKIIDSLERLKSFLLKLNDEI